MSQGLLSNELMSKSSLFGISGDTIKSIQKLIVQPWATTSAVTTKDITISKVNPLNTIVLLNYQLNTAGANYQRPAVVLVNETTVRLLRNESAGVSLNTEVYIQIIEFESIKSKQTGSFTTTTDTSITISKVNSSKSIVFHTAICENPNNDGAFYIDILKFASDTTLAYKNSLASTGTYNKTVHWQVIEFN